VHFELEAAWTALFAASGAGKTTILRMIAGLDRPIDGRIVANNAPLLDTAAGVFVPAYKRRIRMVAQRPALFPHLSVARNIDYGAPKEDLREDPLASSLRFDEIAELCRIDNLRTRMPQQLSGGERQRVALARALASFPADLLMLDEPFTGLEASLRDDIICDLRGYTAKRGIPVLLVTHDLGEVFAAEAHVLKMENGRIVASGPAPEVLAPERERLFDRLQIISR
jgi:molybdate transport system ATP-binding protein